MPKGKAARAKSKGSPRNSDDVERKDVEGMNNQAQMEEAEITAGPSDGEAVEAVGEVVEVEGSKPAEGTPERKPMLGGKRRAVKVKDNNTGTVYDS